VSERLARTTKRVFSETSLRDFRRKNNEETKHMKTIANIIYPALALSAFACFTLLPAPKAFDVVPAPDGGYPGYTTAEGTNALKNLTTGFGNTATGWQSLFANTTGI
jgi:hypothetical protein